MYTCLLNVSARERNGECERESENQRDVESESKTESESENEKANHVLRSLLHIDATNKQTNKQTAIPLFHLVALHIFTATTQTSPFSNPKKMYCPSAEGCTERTAMRRLGTCVNEAGFPSPPKCSSMDGETTAKS